MATPTHDLNELKRRMQGALQLLKQELGGLRTGRASASLLDPIQVEAYGTHMPLNQVATVSVPEPRLLSVQVWDRSMVHAVEKAIAASNLGLTPSTEGQVLRLRIPELNEERRRELVKVAHKYAEAARVAVRHVRRDGLDVLKKLEKDHKISEDDGKRSAEQVQKATDEALAAAEAAYMPKGMVTVPFNPQLINTGSKLILVDTGNSIATLEPTKGAVGRTLQNLAAAGVDPKSIDIVLISHLHPDHTNGIRALDGSMAFPNAELMVPAKEWEFWMSDENAAKADSEITKNYFANVKKMPASSPR